ncbi:ferredoxin [Candidatus Woesearchaeota archaeon]|nr:ferredoxin [Candidatus Woesearchaeota archaeon]MBW2978930.1 ferredoxin [Candidatus Woesearchaeota archaeon]
MAKVTHEKEKCIGCGACTGVCAKYWEMGDDNKAKLKGAEYKDSGEGELELTDADDIKCNKEAESACPVQCIHVQE